MSEPHPLLQPVLVNVLMKFMPKSMWKTSRLVCKLWYDELLPHWRKQMDVCIGGLGKNELLTLTKGGGDTVTKRPFMNVPEFISTYQPNDVGQLEKFPIRSVKTIAGQVTIGWSREVQDKFWNLFGPCLHRLHFHGVMLNDVEILKNIIFRLTPNLQELEFSGCEVEETMTKVEENEPHALANYNADGDVQPNLKVLKITLGAADEYNCFYGKFPLSFLNMFSVFTKIEELRLKEFVQNELYVEFIPYLLDLIATIRGANPDALNIRTLDIKDLCINFTSDSVTKFCNLSLPLEELQMEIPKISNDLQPLFDKYSALTKLVLTKSLQQKPIVKYDVFPQTLKELELIGNVFGDWGILAFTPNLTTLKQTDCKHVPFPNAFRGTNIPRLEFVTTFYYVTTYDDEQPITTPTNHIKRFVIIMPNVQKLGLSVNFAGLKVVCNEWSSLTLWEIPYASMSESVFIANIMKLKSLTCLEFNGARYYDNYTVVMNFGNDSIQKGFLMMPELQRLCITFRHGVRKELLKELYEKVEDTEQVYYVKGSTQRVKYPLKAISGNGCEEATFLY